MQGTERKLPPLSFQISGLEEAIEKVRQEDIKIPFGVGIVGYVAQSKEIINIKDAYKVSSAFKLWLRWTRGQGRVFDTLEN